MTDNQTFADRLYFFRSNKKLTQQQLADAIGLTKSAVSKFESGRSKPSSKTLTIISQLFGTSVDYLLSGNAHSFDTEKKVDVMYTDPPYAQVQKFPSYPSDQNNVHARGLLSDIPIIELRRVSFKARASFNYAQLQRFKDSDIFDTVLFRLPPGRTAEDYADALVFDIEGDSMEPSLRDGQQVIAWPVSEGKWEHLHNTICVVDYDETVTVKAILKNELFDRDGLTLHATGGAGGSFTVARKDIHSIWEVREFYGVVPVRLIP
jgi:repressor LexA